VSIYEELVEKALPSARAKRIKRMVFGLCYTYIEVERTGGGLACTLLPDLRECMGIFTEGLDFWKKPVDIVIKNYLSSSLLESTAGLAAINAILNNKKDVLKQSQGESVFPFLELEEKDEVILVGRIEPVIAHLRGKVKKIWVIEKEDVEKGIDFKEFARRAKVAIVTSAVLVSKTFEDIMRDLEGVKDVVLMGASTPLCPELFRFTPVTYLAGSVVTNGEQVFKSICEGKGAKYLFKNHYLKKVVLRVKK